MSNGIKYGADGMHQKTELLGDQAIALNEGLATFYGYLMNDSGYQKMVETLSDNRKRFFVEGASVLAGENELNKIAARERFILQDEEGDMHYPDGKPIVAFKYSWKTVPGKYLLFAEVTSIAFFSLFRNHTYQNKDTAYSMIRQTSVAMSRDWMRRFLTYACNQLGLIMEEYNDSQTGKADGSRISSMFPFALLDLLTHFGMTDSDYQKDYLLNALFKHPKAYTEYWNHRSKVQALVQADIDASPIKFNDALQKIKTYFKKPEMILAP